MLSTRSGFGLIVDGHVTDRRLKRPVVLKLQDTSIYAVLGWLFRDEDLTWAVERGEILIAPLEHIQPETWNPHIDFVAATEEAWRRKMAQTLKTRRLSVDLDGVPCMRALEVLAERAPFNLVCAPGTGKRLRRRVVVKKQNAPLSEILDDLTAGAGLRWSLESEAVYVEK